MPWCRPPRRLPRKELVRLADGYFSTLQYNTGEIRGARFAAGAVRNENGQAYTDIEKGFKSGRYRYNNRVRDRDCFLVDEERGFVMCRGFIDHKGVLDEYTLTDGTPAKSNYQEPQSWGFLEAFKINVDGIVAVEATFSAVPYFMRSPWTRKPDAVYDASNAANAGECRQIAAAPVLRPSIAIAQISAGPARPAITSVGLTPAAISAPPTSGLTKAPMRATAEAQPEPVARMLEGYSPAAREMMANCMPPVQAPITSSSAPQE